MRRACPKAAVLLLVFAGIAIVALWIRSYGSFEVLASNTQWPSEQLVRTIQLKSYAGRAELSINRTTTNRSDYFDMLAASFPPGWHHIRDGEKLDFSPALFDFECKYDESSSLALREQSSSWRVVVPYWFIFALVLAYPLRQAFARVVSARKQAGASGSLPVRDA